MQIEKTSQPTEPLVDVEAVAAVLGVQPTNVRRRVKNKTIPFRKLGNTTRPRLRFYLSEINSWVNGATLRTIENGITIVRG